MHSALVDENATKKKRKHKMCSGFNVLHMEKVCGRNGYMKKSIGAFVSQNRTNVNKFKIRNKG